MDAPATNARFRGRPPLWLDRVYRESQKRQI